MKLTRGLLVRLIFLAAVIASAFGFAHAQTQLELNQQACASYKKADAEMNKIYLQILRENKQDAQFTVKLKVAQRAWIAFRNAHLDAVYPALDKRNQYGSVHPMCQCMVLGELTAARTKVLRTWIDGVAENEGDVCAGSIKVK